MRRDDERQGKAGADKKWAHIYAEAEAKAERVRLYSPVCVVCGRQITTRGRNATHHESCEPGSLAGKICICLSGCSRTAWGDQGRCDTGCIPCRQMRGRPLAKRGQRRVR